MKPLRETSEIAGYHAHVYFDASSRDVAVELREAIATRFAVKVGRVHDQAVGPHSQPMFQVAFDNDELAKILPWLMLNRSGLNILVHPNTKDEVADHLVNPLWLGTPVALDLEFIRREAKSRGLDTAAIP